MRERKLKLVITFPSTTQAIAMEKKCGENGAAGRLIPVPRQISAGCGIAWCAEVSEREYLEEFLGEFGVQYEHIYEIKI
ncbi:DUF3343 domain-containing protein [Lachnotalea sp. AF33-28]|uniref:DUF3343 domain-containing protein n=1 Tax=Lachnotalea sp. AF33-28 TaxID=2292046 RepID=UPI000E4BECC6|nr:DUF3343 domain-containing protein [Lachnotalea sp. AF33-28]RHP32805.1 DUF3343 domain-containing protein [Lachnotalea sp. AF33-28]